MTFPVFRSASPSWHRQQVTLYLVTGALFVLATLLVTYAVYASRDCQPTFQPGQDVGLGGDRG